MSPREAARREAQRRRAVPHILLDVRRGSRALSMTEDALRHRVRRRQIPFVRIGSRIYFEPERLRAWVAQQQVSAEPTDRTAA
jgi:hypothetical protein